MATKNKDGKAPICPSCNDLEFDSNKQPCLFPPHCSFGLIFLDGFFGSLPTIYLDLRFLMKALVSHKTNIK